MAIASMTGFARAHGRAGEAAFVWELRSVNGRGLDLRLRVPQGLDGVEPQARELAGKRLARGNVQASLSVERPPRPAEVRLNAALLEELAASLRHAAARTGLAPPGLDSLVGVRGVVEVVEAQETDEDRQALSEAVLAGFAEALAALHEARLREGAAIAAVLGGHIDAIEGLVARAEGMAARTPEAVRTRLAEAVRLLVDAEPRLDPDRLHQEAVLAATRADVREELDRLTAHVAHARRLLGEGGAVGRKLDFLAQEFNREANTLCSKSNDRELTEIGLALKTAIDQLREQVQNVE
jgi:uncharacterized protein (TIGR00255 family)